MSKHTEGPWVSRKQIPEMIEHSQVWGDGLLVAYTGHMRTPGEAAANARLIAAAPELLAALEDLLPSAEKEIERLISQMVGGLYPAINAARIERARAAIAKARGDG